MPISMNVLAAIGPCHGLRLGNDLCPTAEWSFRTGAGGRGHHEYIHCGSGCLCHRLVRYRQSGPDRHGSCNLGKSRVRSRTSAQDAGLRRRRLHQASSEGIMRRARTGKTGRLFDQAQPCKCANRHRGTGSPRIDPAAWPTPLTPTAVMMRLQRLSYARKRLITLD